MKKRAAKRQKRPNIVVPPSPYGFEETVQRLLKVKPPRVGEYRVWIHQIDATRWAVSLNGVRPKKHGDFDAALAVAEEMRRLHDAEIWIDDGQGQRRLRR